MSISLLCENGYKINFESDKCSIVDSSNIKVLYVGNMTANLCIIDVVSTVSSNNCLVAKDRRLGHANFELVLKMSKRDLVIGLSKLSYEKDYLCDACQLGMPTRKASKICF